jgi:L-histidine Nalpha-methyltransferase
MRTHVRQARCATADLCPDGDLAPSAAFARDVLAGLSQKQKSIPCTWLYDQKGSQLFEQITQVPEYYPTRTEILILRSCAAEIGAVAGPGVCLIELGSGSSHKTPLLLTALEAPACYVPIDISAQFLDESVRALKARFPLLPMFPVVADFTRLSVLPPRVNAAARRVVFFPGSTIGNLAADAAIALLRQIAKFAGSGSLLVIGADATQDPSVLLPAYDDAQGITAAFNLNLLVRMNRELAANFDPNSFRHAARLDTPQRRVEMHLVSRIEQSVQVAGEAFHFSQGESIHTENSYKYGLLRMQAMASSAGWTQRQMWTDAHAHFGVHVFECVDPGHE